ncbi:MAG: M15 family metallopeptidase [Leptolyngbyaceae cyanobacterium bins.302]|nr:M15 family metallopeptidase [Leptolyngbyaceae cyanobacterium bins.302]
MTAIKPYRQVPIQDCGEPLVPIPQDVFCLIQPHPYEALGAPYAGKSPFWVRQGVCDRLLLAQAHLQRQHPGWNILIFDAFRPLAVQQFMVDYTFADTVQQRGLSLEALTDWQRQDLYEQVYEFWALPDPDPTRPPPHSTGGAVDVTLVNQLGEQVDMGSAIDEISPRSYPNHYATSTSQAEQRFHQHRAWLNQVMTQAGFKRHPQEWWHFCYGDQLWAWLTQQEKGDQSTVALYGRVLDERDRSL